MRDRILASAGLVLAGTFAVFAFLEAAPSTALHRQLGASRPFYVEYFTWLSHVLRGDLGWSPTNSEPVSQALLERLPATIELAFFAFVAVLVIGGAIGFVRARARAPALRSALALPQLVARALPIFSLGIFVQLLLATAPVLPLAGMSSADAFDLGDRLRHLIVPALCLAVPLGAWSSLIFYDYFRSAGAAQGAPRHGIAAPIGLSAALVGPALLTGTLFIETIFAWPGVGRLFYGSLSQFDAAVIAGLLLMYCAAVVLIGLFTELMLVVSERAGPRLPDPPATAASGRRRMSATGVAGLAVMLACVFGVIAASLIAPVGPYFIDQVHWQGYPLAPGVAGHALGTDENGRDLLARLLFALRTSLGIAAFAALVATAAGAAVAQAAKALPWFGERGAVRVAGIHPFAAFPFILVTVALLAVRSHSTHFLTPFVVALIIAAVSWPAIVPALRTVTWATLGAVVDLTACALLIEITQSVIGFGVQPPIASLGNMLVNAQSNTVVAPWVAIVPAVTVIVTLCALYAIGDALHELGSLRAPRG